MIMHPTRRDLIGAATAWCSPRRRCVVGQECKPLLRYRRWMNCRRLES